MVLLIDHKLVEALRLQIEKLSEHIFGPFHTVKSLFREHLESAVRNFSCIIIRVSLCSIGLSFMVREDYLNMALWSEGATIYQRCSGCHTFAVDVEPSLNIIQSIRNYGLINEEILIIDVRSAIMDFVQASFDVIL
jgi:hypothetical protein